MPISALLERPIVLLGGGREGLATLDALRARGHANRITLVGDHRPDPLPAGVQWIPSGSLDKVLRADPVAIRSPGFAPHHPLRQALDAWGGSQTTATRLFLAELGSAGISVCGITASKGKSTISSLLHQVLAGSGQASLLVGNIGVPALSQLDRILVERPQVVMELSSYQCDDLEPNEGPAQVVLGSLFPEHLDWHGSLQAYYGAKARLLSAAPPGAIVHVDQRAADLLEENGLRSALERPDVEFEWVNLSAGLHVAGNHICDGANILLDTTAMRLPGLHNRQNACLAFAAARRHGAGVAALDTALRHYEGLPYRLQEEGLHGGVHWINDSISTAPEAACAGLEAFQGRVMTLIAGGQDRGYDYAPLAAALARWRLPHLIVLPDSGAAIVSALQGLPAEVWRPHVHTAGNLGEAVQVAVAVTPPGLSCLFSPAAPSYHLWSGFEARGQDFRSLVEALG
jgi:UDP-N-acetylmuramoylalanine--D-glutamate ligase